MVDELWRYDGRRVAVTGCASGIGACVASQVRDLGGEVVGLDIATPTAELDEFHRIDMSDAASIDQAVEAVGPVDALFNVAGVSSGIGDPIRVVTINFLGLRRFTDAVVAGMAPGATVVSVSSLAAAGYLDHREQASGLLGTTDMADGIAWCEAHPDAIADGGYRLSKETLIYYTMRQAVPLGARGIRINCTGPGVTETPILDQLRSAYGPQYLDTIPKPLGRVCEPAEQAAVLVFLNSGAASYVTGQVLWVDGGNVAARITEGET
ncbi:NAD(P)-dependent dehydrogenase (short-subunit alcohol dehydrogenase family) [Nocardia transvalensis]|uniref:NAD(P)-dependent dehydrogenase (Short-subunit alcohol dehydrogenase family) n=1 Tax=Nocardia transvalensis TaxID=37333 RepID=A0A7W9PH11_9NOCA|nr:coniferyl-alcohol dehydrogenase [Nocardia transvalensis]MBB5915464.1 NAD(P)-dependent dehydrogenase (short-subunit alcohol dehydrogenase family) [Nocardia transvalensis]